MEYWPWIWEQFLIVLSFITAFDVFVIIYCMAVLAIYNYLNPNLDAERDLYEENRTAYYAMKYSKYLIDIVLVYYAWNIANQVMAHYTVKAKKHFNIK